MAGRGAAGAGFGAAGGGGAAAAAGALAVAPPSPAMIATIAPTGATAPACTLISVKVPVVIDGTSIDTLSVSSSNRLSPGFTAVPGATNHLVILPSATVSPSCGISTSILVFHSGRHAPRRRGIQLLPSKDFRATGSPAFAGDDKRRMLQ